MTKNQKLALVLALFLFLTHPSPQKAAAQKNAAPSPAPNLLANGNFEAGNIGFTSGYLFAAGPTTAPGQEGNYSVGTNPQLMNGLGASFGDHTTGKGQMLIVNGSTNAEGQVVWQQSVPVKPRTLYRLSFWVASWGRYGDEVKAANPAQLEVRINGERLVNPPAIAPATVGQWQMVSVLWVSASASSARIAIIDRNREFIGNDFALDDMAFQNANSPRQSIPSAFSDAAASRRADCWCWSSSLR